MGDRQASWRDTFRALGEALIEVLRAEAAVVGETWKRSGRELGKVLAIVVTAGYLALICLPTLLLAALVSGLIEAFGWPLWATALVVTAVVCLVIFILVRVAVYLMTRRFESPASTMRHRVEDHRAWWSERILSDGREEGEVDGESDTGDGTAGGQPA